MLQPVPPTWSAGRGSGTAPAAGCAEMLEHFSAIIQACTMCETIALTSTLSRKHGLCSYLKHPDGSRSCCVCGNDGNADCLRSHVLPLHALQEVATAVVRRRPPAFQALPAALAGSRASPLRRPRPCMPAGRPLQVRHPNYKLILMSLSVLVRIEHTEMAGDL